MIPVGYLAPADCWDQNIVTLLTTNRLAPTGLTFKRFEGYPHADGCILVISAGSWAGHEDTITEAIAAYDWVLAFRVSDECDKFDVDLVEHENLRWWVQTPRADKDYGAARLFGCGFPPHFNEITHGPNKYTDVFLAAQENHERRRAAFEALTRCEFSKNLIPTAGFTQGISTKRYVEAMCNTKAAPCPSGVFTPDSFRLYEALEAGAVPLADDLSPAYDSRGYWNKIFDDPPFPIYTDPDELPLLISDVKYHYPEMNNRVSEWWKNQKRRYAEWLVEDLQALGAV